MTPVNVLADPLLRYRVMANAVGVVLMVLVFVAIPLRYLGDRPELSMTISPVHGGLYIILVACVVLLGRARGWSLRKIALTALGVTIPICSFVVERRVVAADRAARSTA